MSIIDINGIGAGHCDGAGRGEPAWAGGPTGVARGLATDPEARSVATWDGGVTHDVALLFQRVDLALYGDAHRGFIKRVNPDPRRVTDAWAVRTLRQAFEEWFAFDCRLDETGTTPFDMACRYWREVTGRLGEAEWLTARQISRTERTGWFRVSDASASAGTLTVWDCAGGASRCVHDRRMSAVLDGVRDGTLVGRLARTGASWRLIGTPLMVSRKLEDEWARTRYCQLAPVRHPGFADLTRLLYGLPGGLHASYESLSAYERTHGTESLWRALTRDTTSPGRPAASSTAVDSESC